MALLRTALRARAHQRQQPGPSRSGLDTYISLYDEGRQRIPDSKYRSGHSAKFIKVTAMRFAQPLFVTTVAALLLGFATAASAQNRGLTSPIAPGAESPSIGIGGIGPGNVPVAPGTIAPGEDLEQIAPGGTRIAPGPAGSVSGSQLLGAPAVPSSPTFTTPTAPTTGLAPVPTVPTPAVPTTRMR